MYITLYFLKKKGNNMHVILFAEKIKHVGKS